MEKRYLSRSDLYGLATHPLSPTYSSASTELEGYAGKGLRYDESTYIGFSFERTNPCSVLTIPLEDRCSTGSESGHWVWRDSRERDSPIDRE